MMKKNDMALWEDIKKTVTPLAQAPRRSFIHRFFHLEPRLPMRIDLHGMTVPQAYDALRSFLSAHYDKRTESFEVVTGKGVDGKGAIRREFVLWMDRPDMRDKVADFHYATYNKGGSGAFVVKLKRKPK